MGRTLDQGQSGSADKAKGELCAAVRSVGGWRKGLAGGVNRPSGGGWFARAPVDRYTSLSWEEWEPEVL